jgi:hypothetical protein
VQHNMQLRAAARVRYDEAHLLASPVPFELAERTRAPSWLRAVEEAQEDRAAVAEAMAAMVQMRLL